MSGYRPPYTLKEEKQIFQYIIKNKGYYQLRGRSFWLEMEDSLQSNRTWQSLKEHFCKIMYSKISNPLYELTADEIGQIRVGYTASAKETTAPPVRQQHKTDLFDYLSSSDTD